jgi:hypothetical protein
MWVQTGKVGVLRFLWPVVIAVAILGCSAKKKPPALPAGVVLCPCCNKCMVAGTGDGTCGCKTSCKAGETKCWCRKE